MPEPNQPLGQQNRELLLLVKQDSEYIKRDIAEIKRALTADYITKEEFEPIKRLVYGLVSFVLVSFLSALVGLVIKGGVK